MTNTELEKTIEELEEVLSELEEGTHDAPTKSAVKRTNEKSKKW